MRENQGLKFLLRSTYPVSDGKDDEKKIKMIFRPTF